MNNYEDEDYTSIYESAAGNFIGGEFFFKTDTDGVAIALANRAGLDQSTVRSTSPYYYHGYSPIDPSSWSKGVIDAEGNVHFEGELEAKVPEKLREEVQGLVTVVLEMCDLGPIGEIDMDRAGTHATHCCEKHGCKYGYGRRCPVKAERVEQEYPCEYCVDPQEARQDIKNLQREIEFVEKIQARMAQKNQ